MLRRLGCLLIAVIAIITLVGCGGGSNTQTSSFNDSGAGGTVFVTGSDAPLPSVVAFQINISQLTLSNGSTSTTLEDPGVIEFSRLLGLRTLLSLNSVPSGTYTSAQITLASPQISYLDMTTTPPSVQTINGTLTTNTLNIPLNPALTIGPSGLGGLHLHFDIRNSLFTDGSGQITGQVNPQIQLRALATNTDPDAEIDELLGGVVSVGSTNFVMQRPHGRQITVVVNNQTQWSANDSLATIAAPTTVEVSGTIQADGTLLADEVEVLTHDRAFLGGLIIDVNPPTGDANAITLFVRTEVPDLTGISVPGATTLNVGSSTAYSINNFHTPITSFLFNQQQLVIGQRVGVGGVINTTTNPQSVDVRRVVLRRQGVDGVPASVNVANGNTGTFQLANNGLFGYILGGSPVKVMTASSTVFRNVSGLAGVANAQRVRVVGLLLKDNTGSPVLVAGYVEKLQ